MVLTMSIIPRKIYEAPYNTLVLMAGVIALALAVRLIPLAYSFMGNQVIFPEFDTYYHMRRITYTIMHFPIANIFDSYVNYPNGYMVGWPPLLDVIAASLSMIFGLGHPDRFTIEVVSAMVPVVMGLLSIVLVYCFVRKAMNEKAALIAALVMAILPASVFRTIFGFIDHHALEVLISLTMYLLFMAGISTAQNEKLTFSGLLGSRKVMILAGLSGVALACMIFAWDGAPVFASVIALYAFVQYAYDSYNRINSDYLTVTGMITSMVALAIVAPFAATSYMGQRMEISALYLSWFHIIYLAGLIIFFLFMGMLSKTLSSRGSPWYYTPLLSAVTGVIAIFVLKFSMPAFFENIEGGVSFLAGNGRVVETIVETEPLFMYGGDFSFLIPWTYLSTTLILATLGLLAYIMLDLHGRKARNIEIFLIVWTLIIIILGLLQKRFIYLLAVNVSIFSGYAIYQALKIAGLDEFLGSPRPVKNRKKASRSGSMSPSLLTVVILIVVILVPVLLNSINIVSGQEIYSRDWNDACTWVRDNTPGTSYVYSADMGTMPEYGIMSWWDYGNFILYRAERPAIANNFQTGVFESARFFLAQDEADANIIMDENKARYVMVDSRQGSRYAGAPQGIFDNMPYILGEDPGSYYAVYEVPVGNTTAMAIDGNEKYYNTMYSRLFYNDGCGGNNPRDVMTNGLEHYRLVYATTGIDPVKVFERVNGAIITGTTSPGSKVELNLTIMTPYGERIYYSTATADMSGSYRFTVPYPTSDSTTPIRTSPAYVLTSGDKKVEVEVPADAVKDGKIVHAGAMQ